MAYQIVEWLHDKLAPEDYEDMETLRDAVRSYDQDGKITGWMRNSDWANDEYAGLTLQSTLEAFMGEESERDDLLDEIEQYKKDIEAATSQADMPEPPASRKEIRDRLGADVWREITALEDRRLGELFDLEQERLKEEGE